MCEVRSWSAGTNRDARQIVPSLDPELHDAGVSSLGMTDVASKMGVTEYDADEFYTR